MGISTAVAALTAVSAHEQRKDARKAREQAERDAAKQREALAALEQEPAPVLPTANDADTQRARRRSIISQLRRRGRSSTILTQGSGSGTGETLGA